jgi:hypothetical protein
MSLTISLPSRAAVVRTLVDAVVQEDVVQEVRLIPIIIIITTMTEQPAVAAEIRVFLVTLTTLITLITLITIPIRERLVGSHAT